MNYYKELFYHCFRSIFNHFDKPYCSKWDMFLGDLLNNCEEVTFKENHLCSNEVLTVDFKYKGKIYTVWTGNSFYGSGSIYQLDGKPVEDSLQKRASFNNTFRLLQMVYDYNTNKRLLKKEKFEQDLYGTQNDKRV